jgi:hypothetical protein
VAERAETLGTRFGCVTPDEAVDAHEVFLPLCSRSVRGVLFPSRKQETASFHSGLAPWRQNIAFNFRNPDLPGKRMIPQFFGGATLLRFAPVVPMQQTFDLSHSPSAIIAVFLSRVAWWTGMFNL